MEKIEVGDIDWEHFDKNRFNGIRITARKGFHNIPFGGKYYGHIHIKDVRFDVQLEHSFPDRGDGENLYVGLAPFIPHEPGATSAPYMRIMEGVAIDYVDEAYIQFPADGFFMKMNYETFQEIVAEKIQQVSKLSALQHALRGKSAVIWRTVDEMGKGRGIVLTPKITKPAREKAVLA